MTAVPSNCNQPSVIRIPQVGYHPQKSVVAIALGSNLGQPKLQLERGLASLHQQADVEILQVSPCYWTIPVVWSDTGTTGDSSLNDPSTVERDTPSASHIPAYLNGVAVLTTCLPPPQLMQVLLDIESFQGRERTHKWASRTLDLDILLWENKTLHWIGCDSNQQPKEPVQASPNPGLENNRLRTVDRLPEVIIPHPRMGERPFVMVPLNDLVPHWTMALDGDIETTIGELAESIGTDGVDLANPVELMLPPDCQRPTRAPERPKLD